MADIQKQLIKFHDAIKLGDLEHNKPLREKRDTLIKKLRDGLRKHYKDSEESPPTFEHRNQGSYAMGTGIKPSGGKDYDIDVALLFNVDPDDWEDPTALKSLVHSLLDKNPHTAHMNRPCVTVQYTKDGEDAYHVDFPIYAAPADGRPLPKLALGYPGSSPDRKEWAESDFQGLLTAVTSRFVNSDDQKQFRRCIRYLKRWKDHCFPSGGEAGPRGIGLTCAAIDSFLPVSTTDPVSQVRTDNDLAALRSLCSSMLTKFSTVSEGRAFFTSLPVVPHDNPFERMSSKQVEAFESKLKSLHDALSAAEQEESTAAACDELRKHFGDDFPSPTAKSASAPAVISTGHYA